MSSRRERARRGTLTSTKMLKVRMTISFQREEEEDKKKLHNTVRKGRGDLIQALMCLQEATQYMDIMIRNPIMMGTPRYRKWSIALDTFLSNMRNMVDYRVVPGQHPTEVEECLIKKLQAMRIHEDSAAQKEVRYKLEDAMTRLFDPRVPEVEAIRLRLMGL